MGEGLKDESEVLKERLCLIYFLRLVDIAIPTSLQ